MYLYLSPDNVSYESYYVMVDMVSKPYNLNDLPRYNKEDAVKYKVVKTITLLDINFDRFCENLSQETDLWNDKSGNPISSIGNENICVILKSKK